MGDINKKYDNYIDTMNSELSSFFRNVLKVCMGSPSMAYFIYKLIRRQKRSEKIRRCWEEKGIHVPPYMIASITDRCNLKCKGCYARAHHRQEGGELSQTEWRNVFSDARDLGISVIMLAGGEPFTRPDVLDTTRDFGDVVFPVFTNGTMLDDGMLSKIKKQKNLIPIISMEGYESDTDSRRGKGVFDHVQNVMAKIKKRRIFSGVSLTVTSNNFDTITNDEFISGLMNSGCRLFMFVEYVAVEEGTDNLLLSDSQRLRLKKLMDELPQKYKALFVSFPGDEEKFGGCLAAGRGFVHVSPGGNLEPCPFSPYSDTSLKDIPLKEALKSGFLEKIRENHDRLTETKGGCALWNNRDWVSSILGR